MTMLRIRCRWQLCLFTLVAIFYFHLAASTTALASATTRTIIDDEWETYQCDLPPAQRPHKNPCFCGFLKDRKAEQEAENESSSSARATAGAASSLRGGDGGDLFATPQTQSVETTAAFSTATSVSSSSSCNNGLAANQYPCQNIDLIAHVPLSTFGSQQKGNDVWGWTHTASGREFALLGLASGTAIIEVTNTNNNATPRYLGRIPSTNNVASSWRDVKVYQNHAYIVSEAKNHGLQVFDLTQLLSIGTFASPQVFTPTFHYRDVGSAHNVVINEDTGYAYIVGSNKCSGGLHIVDLRKVASHRTAPQFVACYGGDGYVHDAQCVRYHGPHAAFVGRELCFCSNEDTVTIVDVTNKSNLQQLSRTAYPQAGYTHQGWLSANHAHFIFGDETDEMNQGFRTKTLVLNVKNLKSPSLAGAYYGPTKAIDHNLYTSTDGQYVYLANYEAGLRILQIDHLNTAQFTEVAYFDTYPGNGNNQARFNGAWSVYPFLPSGKVLISDINRGLFVVQPTQLQSTDSPTPSPTPALIPSGVKPVCPNTASRRVKFRKGGRKVTKACRWVAKRQWRIRNFCPKRALGKTGGNGKTVADVCIKECASQTKVCQVRG